MALAGAATAGALAHQRWWTEAPVIIEANASHSELTACDTSRHPAHASLCFGTGATQDDGSILTLVGYFAQRTRGGISGARVELLASGRAALPVSQTGQVAITDAEGHFAFAVLATSGTTRYAFRFPGNAFYPATASKVLSVKASG